MASLHTNVFQGGGKKPEESHTIKENMQNFTDHIPTVTLARIRDAGAVRRQRFQLYHHATPKTKSECERGSRGREKRREQRHKLPAN